MTLPTRRIVQAIRLTALLLAAMLPLSALAQSGEQMWQAAFDGDVNTVKSAVEHGADVNYKGRGGFSALLAAARNGHFEVVKFLVEHGAHIDQRDNNRDKSPLLAASFKGHFEIAQYLIEHGANVNLQGINGWTPLHDAAYVGDVQTVKLLVDHNADLHIKNQRGETARETAERGSHDAVRRGQTRSTPADYRTIVEYIRSHGG